MSPLQKVLQMTGKDVRYISSEELQNRIYSIISFLCEKMNISYAQKKLEANIPITIVNGRSLKIFSLFYICKPYSKPFVRMRPNWKLLEGRRCRAEVPAGRRPPPNSRQDGGTDTITPRRSRATLLGHLSQLGSFAIFLLPYFQDRISAYFCVKYEHLKLTTNTCRPVWAFRLCHHHITASTAQGQVISPPDLSTRRGQPPHERSPESLKGHGQSDKPKAPNGWRGRQVGSTLLSVTCQFLGSHLGTQRNFSEYLPSR